MTRLTQVLFALAAAIVVATAAAPAANAQSVGPPSLSGEIFTLSPLEELQANCNPQGVSTLHYRVSGVAIGPYTGTYVESGTVTIGPHTLPRFVSGLQFGPLTSVEAQFTIFSAFGPVSGRKRLLAQPADAFGLCYDLEGGGKVRIVCACGAWSLGYEAAIDFPFIGMFRDEGKSDLHFQHIEAPGFLASQNFFQEFFVSDRLTLGSTPGLSTGGGQILSTSPGVTFGFEARSDGATANGHCDVVDHRTGHHIVCVDVDQYVQTGNSVIFYGDATIEGDPTSDGRTSTRYRIEATDVDESGIGRDSFGISTDSGYLAEGVLTEGDVQVHQP